LEPLCPFFHLSKHAGLSILTEITVLDKAYKLSLTILTSMPKAIGASKVTSKFQVTIPEAVREKLKVKVGDTLIFAEENGKIIITTEVF